MAEVVVVGAGIAGLAVADALLAGGVDAVCLEATDRVGGRLLSVPAGQASLDLGATWFWPGQPRVRRLADRLGLTVFDQYTDGDAVHDGATGVRRLRGNPLDPPAYRYLDGAQALTDGMAAGLPAGRLVTASPVEQIDVDVDGLWVQSPGWSGRAGHVVLALPPALAVAAIRLGPGFSPELAASAAATPVWMGAVCKVVIEYRQAFWRESGLAGAAVSDRGPLWEVHDMSGPTGQPAALFGFAGGAGADPRMAAEVAVEQTVTQLVRLFGPAAGEPVRVLVRDWSQQPYVSPRASFAPHDRSAFGHPCFGVPAMGGRLHWAGTEVAGEAGGHIEGALASAEATVAAVLACLAR